MNIKFGDSSLNLKVYGSLAKNLKVDGSLANIDRGPRGYSAYEIAVQEGFVGTEEEWLASLVGPEGKQGNDGERGIQGPRGQQGDKGVKGDTGPQGETGATGNGILSIQKTATAGLVDTYTTTFTDGTTTTFDVTNGEDGEVTQEQLDETNENVDWLQTLVNQMPTVSGQGTDLSLQDVLNYRLMKFLPQGNSSQESTTGANILNNINYSLGNIDPSGQDISSGKTYRFNEYIPINEQTTIYLLKRLVAAYYDENKEYISQTSSGSLTLTTPAGTRYARFRTFVGDFSTFNNTDYMVSLSSITSYEPYTDGPAPNPSYPFPVKTVTGENSLVISNSDNTETQSYSISLGNIELNSSSDGTIRDYIYGTPDNWYKREYIGKAVLNGSENWSYTNEIFLISSITDYKITNKNICISSHFISQNNVPSTTQVLDKHITFRNDSKTKRLYIKDSDITSVNDFQAWLSTHNVTIYYELAQYNDIPITDTTLINQLNDIYNNAHSYNGITNITTTYEDGNEQMYLDIEALAKGGSTTTETDPIFSASASSGITSSDISNWNNKASTTYVDTAIANAITNTLGGSF